jgi:hypothetical protein
MTLTPALSLRERERNARILREVALLRKSDFLLPEGEG